MDTWLHDLRFALKSLKSGGWTAIVAVVTIGLGTGVNTAVVAVAYGILARPLPYADAARLAVVTDASGTELDVPLDQQAEWQTRLRTVTAIGVHARADLILRGAGEPRTITAALVTPEFFDVLGVRPIRGDAFRDAAAMEVAISARLAHQLAGSPEAAVGRVADFGQGTYSIRAVMPGTFAFPDERIDAWIPARSVAGVTVFSRRDARRFHLIARLRPGVTLQQAIGDTQRVMADIDAAGPQQREPHRVSLRVLSDVLSASMRPVLRAFSAAAILVLLVACANVATLLVSRAMAREREFAVRLALGADATRLIRGALAESLLLALAGSVVGIAVAGGLLRLFARVASGVIPRVTAISLDLPVLGMSLGAALAVTLLCGVAPALSAARTKFAPAFRQHGVAGSLPGRHLRAGLVIAQIALSIVLLAGAGLLARTVLRLLHEDLGIEPTRALTMKLMLTDTAGFTAAGRGPFMEELLGRVRALPGVQRAGIGSNLPPRVSQLQVGYRIVSGRRDESFRVNLVSITPGYLEALGARLVRGQLFEAGDAGDGLRVVLSQTAARQFSAEMDPIGRELPVGLPGVRGQKTRPRVIGIVADIKFTGLDTRAGGSVYVPWRELPSGISYLVIRTAGDPSALSESVRRLVRDMDPRIPIPQLVTLDEEMALSIAERRLRVVPALALAILALAVALVGLSATLSRGVTERRRELAIRLALGATPRRTVGMIVRQGAILTTAGLVLGIGAAAASARALSRLLYGVTPHDPVTFVSVAVLIGGVALIACYLPARRAARIEPQELLR